MNFSVEGPIRLTTPVLGVFFDHPRDSRAVEGPNVRLAGWLACAIALRPALHIHQGGRRILTTLLTERPDVVAARGTANGYVYGFDLVVHTSTLTNPRSVSAWAESADGVDFPAFQVKFHPDSEPLSTSGLSPCHLVSTGRSGSTHLMKVLGSHPELVISPSFPHEAMQSLWLARRCLLASSAALHTSTSDFFGSAQDGLAPSPFLNADVVAPEDLLRLLNRTFLTERARVGEDFKSFYESITSKAAQARFAVEKCPPDWLASLTRDVFPGARSLFLLRDPRDVLASRIGFRLKRGDPEFGFEHGRRDRIGLADLIHDYEAVLACIRATPAGNGLVVRFEDLMLKFDSSMSRIAGHLGLASVEFSSEWGNSVESAKHRTASVGEEVARWKTVLPTDLTDAVTSNLKSFLTEFGYEV